MLLDHSASDSRLLTNHSVTFAGLNSARIYYFQVASRDIAGNTIVDDNNGNLFTFKTLSAPQPPWFDNLESGAPGWSNAPDPNVGGNSSWGLGPPPSGALQTTAHSGVNVWDSALAGSRTTPTPAVALGGYLISPAIDLFRRQPG